MKSLRIALFLGAGIVAVWLAGCAVAGIMAADWALHPARNPLTPDDEGQAKAIAGANRAILESVAISASDGAVLRAWYIHPMDSDGDAVILLHGQADNRAGMLGPAALLLSHGYSVLMPDARAQGLSGGAIATYGVKEADDIRRWYEWLAQANSPHCIDALGDSMGAAQALQSLTVERGFCAVVAESSFASFREASYDRIGQWFGTGPWLARTILQPVVDFGFLYARFRYGVNLASDNPAATVAGSRVSVFLIHGLLDNNLPPSNSEMILHASREHDRVAVNVALWEPANAGHIGAAGSEPQEYERRVLGWFASHQTRIPY
jgi:hypothetical protein